MSRKMIYFSVAVAILIAIPLGSVFAYESFIGPTGVLQYDKTKAYNGYTLFSSNAAGCTSSYLIDMEGYVVHEWKTQYVAGLHDVLLENGNLLRGADLTLSAGGNLKVMRQPYKIGGGHAGLLQEFDWNGNLVWEYELNTPTAVQHHTFTRHPTNGNTLILGWEYKSYDEAVAKGRNPATVNKTRGLWPDFIIEVNRAKQVVWEYHVWDHLGTGPDQYDINFIVPGMADVATQAQDWTHWNTANYHPTEDKIITNSRHFGESYVIDKKTGNMVYRIGNPSAYGAGKAPSFMQDGDQILFGPHHAHVIEPGLPGAGHLLILENGWNRPEGNRTGTIEVDMTKGNTKAAIVWQYFSSTPNSLYSASQCSNQRLPNGNTVITSTVNGHLIEVTPKKEVVWEFINPITSKRVGDVTTYPVVNCVYKDITPNSIHRSTRYGADFPGLKGKDLSKKVPLALGCPEFWKLYRGFMEK